MISDFRSVVGAAADGVAVFQKGISESCEHNRWLEGAMMALSFQSLRGHYHGAIFSSSTRTYFKHTIPCASMYVFCSKERSLGISFINFSLQVPVTSLTALHFPHHY